ncbi:MAG: AAA family ATPase [Actinobacteria bacterium]|nr:AAA family ATPase [Actinomycetota bacterium]MCA1722315.1 AAA family ATPase [Actinomycetota bacterium]
MLPLTAVLHPSALDARRGIVRLHPSVLAGLGLAVWDTVLLTGRRTTGALAAVAPPDSDPRAVLCDDLVLGNMGVGDGATVDVAAAPPVQAVHVTVAGEAGVVAAVDPAVLRTALLGKVLTAGDNVSLLPQDLAPLGAFDVVTTRKSLAARLGPAWTSMLLTVADVSPAGPALVTMASVVGWQGGTTTTGSATPLVAPTAATPRTVADLPGLESQAAALKEWLDLGFHHRDLLARLGTSPGMGVLVTGPAGSGKAALVEAVAASVGARLLRAWAPQLAALQPDAAAAQIRSLLTQPGPAVVLLEDVEALAPRDSSSPLVPVFLAAVRETVAAGRVAVVCTTARPESVDPALRTPGTLDHEVAIPLPDRPQRLRLLEVATHSVPLDADLPLDDVAGRTPGFVAADLLALVKEAGLRAAARQRDAASPTVARTDFDAALQVVRPTALGGETLDISPLTLDEVGDMVEVKAAVTEAVLWPLQYPDTFARLGVAAPRGLLLYGPPGCGKTFLVKAIAGSGQCNVLSVKGAELLSKWVGESERAVRELFRRAREAAPTLVFLDEVDALAPVRGQSTDGGTTDRIVAALLTELDGVESLRDVVVVGATNRPDLVDPALLRPGRLERLVFVPPPDADARVQILRAASRDVPLDASVDVAALGVRTEGFSAADCSALVREAALTAMRESMAAATVTAAHVEAALATVRPSLDPVQVAALQAYADRRA